MFCGQCGANVVENARFCGRCGALQSEVSADEPNVAPDGGTTTDADRTVVMDVRDLTNPSPLVATTSPERLGDLPETDVDTPETPAGQPSDEHVAPLPRPAVSSSETPDAAEETEESVGSAETEQDPAADGDDARSDMIGLPRVSLVADLDDRPGSHEELDLRWESQRWIVASPGESVLARWICTESMCVLPTDGGATTVFRGAGIWTLTTRRLVGLLSTGESLEGQIGRNGALFVALPLSEVSSVSLLREQSSRGFKEKAVTVDMPRSSVMLDLDRVIDERRRASKEERVEGMRRIVRAVADAKRPGASADLVVTLDKAVAGEWELEETDLVAELGPAAADGGGGGVTHSAVPANRSSADRPAESTVDSATSREERAPPVPSSLLAGPPPSPSTRFLDAPPPSGVPRANLPPPAAREIPPRASEPAFTAPPTSTTPGAPEIPPRASEPAFTAPPPSTTWAMSPPAVNLRVGMGVPVRDSLKTVSFAAAGACLLLLVDLLLPWQSYGGSGFTASRSGAHGLGVLVILVAIVLGIGVLLVGMRQPLPIARRSAGFTFLGGGLFLVLGTFTHGISTHGFETGWLRVGLLLGLGAGVLTGLVGSALAFLVDGDDDLPVRDAIVRARGRGLGNPSTPRPPRSVAPAGWYDDPQRAGGKRWWDGAAWQMTDVEYHERARGDS